MPDELAPLLANPDAVDIAAGEAAEAVRAAGPQSDKVELYSAAIVSSTALAVVRRRGRDDLELVQLYEQDDSWSAIASRNFSCTSIAGCAD